MIYLNRPRSYRELPLRLAEYGTVYRFEKSGQLAGLLRVRGLAMNDAHIYCTREQIKDGDQEGRGACTRCTSRNSAWIRSGCAFPPRPGQGEIRRERGTLDRNRKYSPRCVERIEAWNMRKCRVRPPSTAPRSTIRLKMYWDGRKPPLRFSWILLPPSGSNWNTPPRTVPNKRPLSSTGLRWVPMKGSFHSSLNDGAALSRRGCRPSGPDRARGR